MALLTKPRTREEATDIAREFVVGNSIVRRVQYIKWFVIDPCEAPFLVYLETAKQPLGDLILALFTFDVKEIIKLLLMPSGLGGCRQRDNRNRRNGKGRQARSRNPANMAPDPNAIVVQRMLKGVSRTSPSINGVERAGWTFLLAIDNINWNIFFYDAILDFLFAWASGIMATQYCQDSTTARVRMFETSYGAFPSDGFERMPFVGERIAFGAATFSFADARFAAQGFTFTTGFEVRNTGTATRTHTFQLWTTHTSGSTLHEEITVTLEPQASFGVVLQARTGEPGAVFVNVDKNNFPLQVARWTAYGIANGPGAG